ncbi:MAG: putative 2-aminoethylphosphonate ABC transporter ATP-binding protein [Holophaga sp.]|nr:putative 2-aminoethylphosphonate ABC transporter ATP-binding protein [Holophaga sp.]
MSEFLSVQGIVKRFGAFTALADINLQVAKGEFLCLLGPSGCGKTTLLRIIAGLEAQDQGRVLVEGRDIGHLPPAKRDYGIVFQNYALFPNLNIAQNIGYGLRTSRAQRRLRVEELLALVGLSGDERKYPSQLSGGQQQRVALARALAACPKLLLLDEPLSALDARVRVHLRQELKQLHQKLGITTIMVTHDQEEALSLADTVAVMDHGTLEQVGSPEQIYHQPATQFVADFVGRSNFPPVTVHPDGKVELAGQQISVAGSYPAGSARLFCRPEDLQIGRHQEPNLFMGMVEGLEFLGPVRRVTLRLEQARDIVLSVDLSAKDAGIATGQRVPVSFPVDRLRLFTEKAV